MVAISEKQKIKTFSNTNIFEENFYEDMNSIETLKRDLVLIKESEDM